MTEGHSLSKDGGTRFGNSLSMGGSLRLCSIICLQGGGARSACRTCSASMGGLSAGEGSQRAPIQVRTGRAAVCIPSRSSSKGAPGAIALNQLM